MANWTSLRAALRGVESSVTYRWEDLDAIVGGLPRSAYVHSAFWKGDRSGWPGFTTMDVRVGSSVTFVRRGVDHRQPEAPRAHPNSPAAYRAVRSDQVAPDLVLVGCVKKKLDAPAVAADLYASPLFHKERAYAEATNAPWFVLSAEHGLVRPEEVLAPYDLRLSTTSREYRRAWGVRVVAALELAAGPLADKTIEIHAGSAYTDAIRDLLRTAGATVIEPLAGLSMGRRLAWYGATPGHLPEPAARPTSPANAEIEDLVGMLTAYDTSVSPTEFLASAGVGLQSPGLYSWWVDEAGADELARGLGVEVPSGLIYAGLAGATRAKGGRKSKNTLWGRIRTMHLGGRHEFSTFRLSLGSILTEAAGSAEIDESELTAWMHAHLRLITVPVDNADTLGAVETDVLARLDPPLNLDKVPRTSLRSRLSALRKQYSHKGNRPSA